MTNEVWSEICGEVTDRMLRHVRNFVCPLSFETETDVHLIGTGSFIEVGKRTAIITCEHVADKQPLNYKFADSENIYGYRGTWKSQRDPVDASITNGVLCPSPSSHQVLKSHRFASAHIISKQAELLFFCGFAGENSKYVFEHHFTNLTGYCTQENAKAENIDSSFEIHWPNGLEKWTNGTVEQAKKQIKFSDPRGFSGSLIWNTRFVELGCDLINWSPNDAKITGLIKQFDQTNGVLLATPIEKVHQIIGL